MKLVHPDWEKQIRWKEGKIPIISIENGPLLFQTAETLRRQTEGEDGPFLLCDGEEELSLGKYALFCASPWNMDGSEKKLLTAFYKEVKDELAGESWQMKKVELESALLRFAEELRCTSDIDITYDDEADALALLKTIHLKPEAPVGTVEERMLSYMKLARELLPVRCFIFYGFSSFLTGESRHELYRNILSNQFSLLLLEGRCHSIVEEEDRFTIDEDLCQIF